MQSLEKEKSQIVLKALSGPQCGVEVALADGEYTLGSGRDDDLQFVDVCLKSGHARIRIDGPRILIAGGAGSVTNQAGLVIEAGSDDWRELQPMDIVSIGANAFAIGPIDGNWPELPILRAPGDAVQRDSGSKPIDFAAGHWIRKHKRLSAVLISSMIVTAWLSFGIFAGDESQGRVALNPSVDEVREVLDRYPFGKPINVRQEVDGAIYAEGYVSTPVERRALHAALKEASFPVFLRLGVLSSIRTQVTAAINSFEVDVDFELTQDGKLVLAGTILSDEEATQFLDYVRTEIDGFSAIETDIKTASVLFAEVKSLAQRANIDDTVLFRLTGQRIEASGVVVTNKVDEWVGFIQTYAKRYAAQIPLTSYVQLVNDRGQVLADSVPMRLADPDLPEEQGVINLDLSRLKMGLINPSDLFGGVNSEPGGSLAAQSRLASNQSETLPDESTSAPSDLKKSIVTPSFDAPTRSNAQSRPIGVQTPHEDKPSNSTNSDMAEFDFEEKIEDEVGGQVLERWSEREKEPALAGQDSSSPKASEETPRQRYLPLITNPVANADRCWDRSRLRVSDLPKVLFWLDYLSLSEQVSLVGFDLERQYLILEAALNPDRLLQCSAKFKQRYGIGFSTLSLFFEEVDRNPYFIRYLVRDFEIPKLDVAGVMLQEGDRFIQTRDGRKLREGNSPNKESKLMSVGVLGALLRQEDEVTPILYSERLAWKATSN